MEEQRYCGLGHVKKWSEKSQQWWCNSCSNIRKKARKEGVVLPKRNGRHPQNKCRKGHQNWVTVVYKNGTQRHCGTCKKLYLTTHWRAKVYGASAKEIEKIAIEQNHVCAICKQPETDNRSKILSIDHDHKSGKVRGLLCNKCNIGIGAFRDNPIFLESAIDYLKKHICLTALRYVPPPT